MTVELANQGHRVFASSRKIGRQLRCLSLEYRDVLVYEMDVSKENSVRETAQQMARYDDNLDVVVSNAGILIPGDREATVFSLDSQALEAMLQVNVIGAARVIRYFSPLIRSNGLFATITSEAGSISNTFSSMPGYAVSKAAENKLVAIQNISETKYRSIAIHPGRVDTDMNRESAEIAPSECAKDLADILTGKKRLPEKEWFFNYLGEPMQH